MSKKSCLFLAAFCFIQNQLHTSQHIIAAVYPNTYEDLLEAASAGNISEIRRLVQEEEIAVDPDEAESDQDNETALMAAAENGQVAAITELVNLGANIDFHDVSGTALMRAASNGQVGAITELVRLGADLEGRSNAGFTAIMRAATSLIAPARKLEAINELARLGADINATADDGDTALMNAAQQGGSIEVIVELVRLGANINVQDDFGGTALTHAVEADQPQTVVTLLNLGARPNERFWKKADENPEIMRAIKQYMAEHEKTMHSITQTAISSMSKKRSIGTRDTSSEVRKYLKPNFGSKVATSSEQKEEKEKEEKEGKASDFEMTTTSSIQSKPSIQIPLMQAEQTRMNNLLLNSIKQKNTTVEMINEWLDLNAQLGSQDNEGYTPLMLAVIYNRPDLFDALLERINRQPYSKGSLDMADQGNMTALAWAKRMKRNDLIAKLLRSGAE